MKNFSGDKSKFKESFLLEAEHKDTSAKTNSNSEIDFSLTRSTFVEDEKIGDITSYEMQVINLNSDEVQGMVVAKIRIPSCQQPDFETLERLQKEGDISYFELLNYNTEIILYWRGLDKGQTKEVTISMIRKYKSEHCVERPSKAYLYYDSEGSEIWTNK